MKTINYTGRSKLISRIVHLLNRKTPLPLNADGDAEWGTSGQVLTTDGQGNTSWTTPQGGGGDVTDVEVNGTSVVNAQGVAEVSVPTNTSDLNNDSGFITNLVNDLANYYTKSQTYTQAEVNALISGIVTLNILVVQALPTQDISTTTIYLVPKQDAESSDIYDEYLYINNAWELIGTTQIDLSNYVTTTDLSTALADYVTSVGLATILAGYVQSSDLATVATSGSYNDLSDKPTIPTVTKTVYYGTCTGQAANQTKAVVVDSSQGFALTAGIILLVKFDANNTYSATAAAPVKLNVNSTGAKNIYYAASNAPTGTNTTAFGRTNYVNQYYYDGTNWIWSGSSADNNTTYSNMSASELTTGTATTARSISAKVLTDWLVAKLTASNVAYDSNDSVKEKIDSMNFIPVEEYSSDTCADMYADYGDFTFGAGSVNGGAGKDTPTTSTAWRILQTRLDAYNGIQFAYHTDTDDVYLRRIDGGTWSTWERFLVSANIAWKTETVVNATSLTLSGDWEEAIIAWTPYPTAGGRTTLTAHITKGIVNTVGNTFVVEITRDSNNNQMSMLCSVSVSGNTFTLTNATWAGTSLLNSSRLTVSYR